MNEYDSSATYNPKKGWRISQFNSNSDNQGRKVPELSGSNSVSSEELKATNTPPPTPPTTPKTKTPPTPPNKTKTKQKKEKNQNQAKLFPAAAKQSNLDPKTFRLPCLCDVYGDLVFGKPFIEREKGTKLFKIKKRNY